MRWALAVVALAIAIAVFLSRAPTKPSTAGVVAEAERARSEQARARRSARADASVAVRAAPSTHSFTVGWGSGPSQVGRRQNPESVGEGPMSFVVGKDGTAYLLDQVNSRVLRRAGDGHYLPPIALARDTAQDLRVDSHGNVGVLDRLGDKTLVRYDANGQETSKLALSTLGLAEGGGATGLFDTDTGELYVEESLRGQGKRVVHGVDGASVLAGRPSRDGQQLVQAAITGRASGNFVVRGLELDGTQRWETALDVTPSLLTIVLCETDSTGEVFVGVLHARTAPPNDLENETLDLFRLRSDGTPVGHLSVAHPPSTLDVFRELSVSEDGSVYWMHPGTDGAGIVVDTLGL